MTWLIDLILGPVGAALGGLAVIVVTYFSGKSKGKLDAERKDMKAERAAHERINDAEIGIGASDTERRKRLRDLGEQWGSD
ncbi:MAG: hypothetical protein Tp118SUR00d2C21406231_24 [Prokaryotic dsDNA virus sp.]|nr:MAG: hypothetical protein Tp125DCM00d2C40298531_43 [Prokaryotic dsDNA virus sp.]QDP53144.1 MAG: hypothetical protein Tp118SUR00d2C21406231_24 [Prokaryotic dsDNA virus sp.]|tara:strand:+ start:17896 stop:18138 length:243 start_codon:yes stop_codon:yes gene_type:complete